MARRRHNAFFPGGFTLTELVLVIAIIMIAIGVALPGVVGLLTADAEVQARKTLGALLGAARSLAIEKQSYVMVHVQMGLDGNCWAGVLERKLSGDPGDNEHRFVPVAAHPPRQIPEGYAFGEISDDSTSGGHFVGISDGGLHDFTSFHVIFGPDGSLAQLVPERDGTLVNARFDKGQAIFTGGPTADEEIKVWDDDDDLLREPGVPRAIVMFPYSELEPLSVGAWDVPGSRACYLERNRRFLVINPYTGHVLAGE